MEKIMGALTRAYKTNKQLVLYLFFGICTTAINTVAYCLFYEVLAWSNISCTILAWIFAVVFAFITNKIFVFESRKTGAAECWKEVTSFFGCRLLTGILDALIMIVAVDILRRNGLLWKLITNIMVIIINYIASKFVIFKK